MQIKLTSGNAMFLLAVAVIAVYANGLNGPFVLDDSYSIVENPAVQTLWPPWVALNPPPVNMTFYARPFVNLTACVDYAIWGLNPRGYHLTSLAFHLLATLAFFGLVRRTLTTIGRAEGEAALVGFASALLWAVHPLLTAAVNYPSQRGELAVGLFLFLMLYALNRAAAGPARPWSALAVFCCLLGMGSKETMAAAPFLALAYDRVFLAGSWREALRRRGGFYLLLAATWAWPLWKHLHFSPQAQGDVMNPTTWHAYLLTQTWGLNRMIRLMLWPHPLIFDYGLGLALRFAEVRAAAIGLLLLIGLGAWSWFRFPRVGFAVLCFFAVLAPASLFPVTGQPIAEHRMYVPLAPAMLLAVLGAAALGRERRWTAREAAIAIGVVAVILGGLTVHRNRQFRSAAALWTDTIAKWPGNARAWYNRGYFFQGQGKTDAALADYARSLELNPRYVNPMVNRAKIHFDRRDLPAAAADLDAALALLPDWPEILTRRAMIRRLLGRHAEAALDLEHAARLEPENAVFMNELAWVLATATDETVRDPARALALAQRAAGLTDQDYHALDTLAAAHAAGGQFETARTLAREAVAQARQRGDAAAAKRIGERLARYENNAPWSE